MSGMMQVPFTNMSKWLATVFCQCDLVLEVNVSGTDILTNQRTIETTNHADGLPVTLQWFWKLLHCRSNSRWVDSWDSETYKPGVNIVGRHVFHSPWQRC